jgi:hypothetical protein
MTEDEIIRLAVQCQLANGSNSEGIYFQALQSFAKLIAEKEREACARVCEGYIVRGLGAEMARSVRARGNK